jgi:hypothetical protein
MDYKNLQSDPCDRKLIRCNNCLQVLACVCTILSFFIRELGSLAQCIRCAADITYCAISSCMAAQVNFEIADGSMMPGAVPAKQVMTDGQTTVVVMEQPMQGQPVYVQQPQQGYPVQQQPMYGQPGQQMMR